jgi:hypothetical protein
VWNEAARRVSEFGPVAAQFLASHGLAGMNFDWEDSVDTHVYMKLLSGLRKAFDDATAAGASGGKRMLITVAPGWPRYPWDATAIGVVDAFDMMSYNDELSDLTSRVALFTGTYGLPKSMLLGAIETEPHWQGTPGWNSDPDIVQKTKYAVETQLQGMFSFRIDNDHGPWPVTPRQPTYHGHQLMAATAMAATGGELRGFVLNTYMSLHDPFQPGQLC